MNSTQTTTYTTQPTTADLIAAAMEQAERSASWVAEKAGITPSTLRRKLKGTRDFTTGELAQIAAALGVRPSSFSPDRVPGCGVSAMDASALTGGDPQVESLRAEVHDLLEQAAMLRRVLAKEIDVDDIAGDHNHTDLRSTANQPVTSHYYRADCPACAYIVRAVAELDGEQELSVGLVGRCCDYLGVTVDRLLVDAEGCPSWCDEHLRGPASIGWDDLTAHQQRIDCGTAARKGAEVLVVELPEPSGAELAGPHVNLYAQSLSLTAAEARQVAGALLDAAEIAEGGRE